MNCPHTILLAFVAVGLSQPVLSQSLFAPLDEGLSTGGPRAFLEDENMDRLYVGGAAVYAGDVISPGAFMWNGNQFQAMGCGFNWDCITELGEGGLGYGVMTLAVWDDHLYAGGNLTSATGTIVNHAAKWNGNNWEPLGIGLNDQVVRLRSGEDGLYAVGFLPRPVELLPMVWLGGMGTSGIAFMTCHCWVQR